MGQQDDILLKNLDEIDQTQCFSGDEVDYNIKINENGLSLMSLQKDKELHQFQTPEEAADFFKVNDTQ